MIIECGLFKNMVMQRNSKNVSEGHFWGTAKANGIVSASVKKSGKTLSGFKNIKVGEAKRGKLSGIIKGLKVGGPYDVELTITDPHGKKIESKIINNILVGDVWILAGQSNMQGVGFTKHTPKAIDEVRAYYMDERWAPAKEPVHNMWAAKDRAHLLVKNRTVLPPKNLAIGAGPGAAFGHKMFGYSGIPQGLVPCALGGTSMNQWSPSLKKEGDKSLYGAMYGRFLKQGARVAGILWYQGCSDAGIDACKVYASKMKNFVRSCRRDFKNKDLPFLMVQIGRVISAERNEEYWTRIRDEQNKLSDVFKKNFAVVAATDLELEDIIHITGKDHNILGRRLAYAANRIVNNKKAGKPEMKLKKMKVYPNPVYKHYGTVELTYDNVAGKLVSAGRPLGFEINGEKNRNLIFRTELKGNKVLLHSALSIPDLKKGHNLYYGKGLDPACNIIDEEGRSLLGFGPLKIR